MEAAPSASFIVPQPDLLLELLIVAFDAPSQFGDVDQVAQRDVFRQGREPVLGRCVLALGPFDQQPLFGEFINGDVLIGYANAQTRKARGQHVGCALPPLDRLPCVLGQIARDLLDRDEVGIVAPSPLRPRAARLRPRAGLPHQRGRLDARHIAQSLLRDAPAQLGVATIVGVHQHHASRQAGLTRPADLLERDLLLGLEPDPRRHPGLAPTGAVLGPLARQIQPIRHRQARMMIGNRQQHRDLAVALPPELPAILRCDPDRVLPLLGKTGVIDDPRLDRPVALHRGQHQLAHLAQHLLVRPLRLADKMQQ